jgi:serine/threonine protein kinase
VIKSVSGHPRVEHERDILRLFDKSPLLRKLVDEIDEPAQPITIVLEYLDADLDQCSKEKKLNRHELKYVSRRILQALDTLHDQGYVHTGQYLCTSLVLTLTH